MPQRIRRSRAKGSRLPEGAVCVTRPGKWSNPHKPATGSRADLEACVERYRQDLFAGRLPFSMGDAIRDLGGKDLACWCHLTDPCHADVLLAVANWTRT